MAKDDLALDFEKLFGGNDEEATVSQFLDTGYAPLNYALSSRWDGGLAVGRITEISGPPSSGKTAISTAAMAAAQARGGIAAFMDHERSFSLKLAPKLGVNIDAKSFIYKKPRTYEESLALCVQVAKYVRDGKKIPADAPICWVFDSLASMVPMSVLFDPKTGKERGLDTRNMNDNTALARATSATMPAFAQYVEELNICCIFLNQLRTKIGVMYGDPRTTPGGDSPKFYASTRVMLGAAKKIQKGAGESAEVMGSEISAAVIKNKVARPFLKASWRFVFNADGTGKFDATRSTIDFLVAEGIIEDAGKGRVKFDGGTPHRDALARKIEEEGRMKDLMALLPKRYEPEILAETELPELEEAA